MIIVLLVKIEIKTGTKEITENLSSEEMTNYLRAFVTFAVKYFD